MAPTWSKRREKPMSVGSASAIGKALKGSKRQRWVVSCRDASRSYPRCLSRKLPCCFRPSPAIAYAALSLATRMPTKTSLPPSCINHWTRLASRLRTKSAKYTALENGRLREHEMRSSVIGEVNRHPATSLCLLELSSFPKKKRQYSQVKRWRRERDSNPRYGFPHTHFPGVRLQPLGHPSDRRSGALASPAAGATP